MKLRADSFAARLTTAQKEQLFADLVGGGAVKAAARQVKDWTGKQPSEQAVSAWLRGAVVERKHSAAREAMLVAQANCPADFDAQARLALGQAKYLAVLDDLEPRDVAAFEKNALLERKLALDEQKLAQDQRLARRDLALDRARLLLERARGGESGEELQQQIDLALEEIQRLKHGEAT